MNGVKLTAYNKLRYYELSRGVNFPRVGLDRKVVWRRTDERDFGEELILKLIKLLYFPLTGNIRIYKPRTAARSSPAR